MALMGVSFGGTIDDKLEGNPWLRDSLPIYPLSSFTCAASFRLFDEDGNGELDRQEVERMLILVMKSMVPPFLFDSALPYYELVLTTPTVEEDVCSF
jgi:hypothetical protein